MAANSETSFRDVYRALFRHKKKALSFFLAVMAAAVAVLIFLPRSYRSEGKLFIRLGRANTTLDPTAGAGAEPVVVVPTSREEEINSVVDILRCRAILEKVVDTLGPEEIVPPESPEGGPGKTVVASIGMSDAQDPVPREQPLLERLNLKTPLSPRERAILLLGKRVKIEPVRKSNVIQISCTGPSPEGCQKIVACLIDSYLKEHLRLNRTTGVHSFFVEQTSRSEQALADSQRRLRDLKNSTGLASPTKQRDLVVERVSRLEDQLAQTAEDLAVAQKRVDWLKDRMVTTSERHTTQEVAGVGDYGTDMMRQQFYNLTVQEQELEAKYTDEHPKLQAIRQQREAAGKTLAQESPTRTQTTTGRNATYEAIQLELVRQEPIVASLNTQAAMQRSELADARADLKALNENEVRVADLQREVDLHEVEYRKYAADLEQARIDEALETERISNVSVAQPATLEVYPVIPNKRITLAVALILGLGGAVGLALVSELSNPSIRTPADVERELDLPTLASIPHLGRRQLVLNGKGARNGH